MPALVKRGRDLAAIGNCNDCHTVRGGKSFAGGLPVPTPFGTIYSSNITPDAETGIGRWSEAAFRRAMRSGVDRDGQHLYPTFPYDHFTNVSDEDDRALYAFLMTRRAGPRAGARQPACLSARSARCRRRLEAAVPASRQLPAGQQPRARNGIAAPIWSRGSRIAAPATPRATRSARSAPSASFAGGDVDNWQAYAINAQSPAPVPWDADALFAYLRHGWHPDHGIARGPMAEVVSNLSQVAGERRARDRDLYGRCVRRADAGSQAAGRGGAGAGQVAPAAPASQANAAGAAIYAAACATCHESGRPLPYGGINLALSAPRSAVPIRATLANIVLSGVRPVEGERSPIMPGFAASMNDAQIAALLNYLRSRFSNQPAMDRR